jgi:hypothetical protein
MCIETFFLSWDKPFRQPHQISQSHVLVEVPHLPQLFGQAQEWFALPHRKLHQGCNVTA